LSQLRFFAVLLTLCLAVGCKGQTGSQGSTDQAANRRIELLIRSQFNLPANYDVSIGARKPSKMNGYDELPVTVSYGSRSQAIDFLISTDGKKLARLETYDLTKDPAAAIDIAGRPVRGNPKAKVTIVSFDDLECPFCARMHEQLFPSTMAHYRDQIRIVYKDFPLVEIHPWAMHASVNADCLAAQNGDAYWKYVDYLHTHSEEVTGKDRNLDKSNATLDRLAREQGAAGKLDTAKLDACIAKQDESTVKESLKLASSLGLDGAPTLFVNGERINGGAVPEDVLWAAIDRAIRAEGEQPPAEPPTPAKANAGN
jgi:protein-disulfide isomerase